MNPIAELIAQQVAAFASWVSTQALAADPAVARQLANLAGKVIEVKVAPPTPVAQLVGAPTTWQFECQHHAIVVSANPAKTPHARLSAPATQLLQWLATSGRSGTVTIDGDTTLVLELADLARQYQPDLTQQLEVWLGSLGTANLLGSAETILAGLKSAAQGLDETIKSRAQENLVGDDEFADVLNRIDDLRLRVDRLSAKISRHEQSAPGE